MEEQSPMSPEALAEVFKQLQPGMKVQVTSRHYTQRTLTVKAAHPAAWNPEILYCYVSSGRTMRRNMEGGLLRYDTTDGSVSYQPTLLQRVSDVVALEIA